MRLGYAPASSKASAIQSPPALGGLKPRMNARECSRKDGKGRTGGWMVPGEGPRADTDGRESPSAAHPLGKNAGGHGFPPVGGHTGEAGKEIGRGLFLFPPAYLGECRGLVFTVPRPSGRCGPPFAGCPRRRNTRSCQISKSHCDSRESHCDLHELQCDSRESQCDLHLWHGKSGRIQGARVWAEPFGGRRKRSADAGRVGRARAGIFRPRPAGEII